MAIDFMVALGAANTDGKMARLVMPSEFPQITFFSVRTHLSMRRRFFHPAYNWNGSLQTAHAYTRSRSGLRTGDIAGVEAPMITWKVSLIATRAA